jgi:uncharacterized cupredoxin-like copper-binding protein
MMSNVLPVSILVAVGAVFVGSRAPDPAPRSVTVVATEYAFSMPDTLRSGAVALRLVNRGHELHHLYLARLDAGKSAADLVAAMKAGGPPPAWATDIGGPNGADPGSTSLTTTVTLAPGHYAALCVIPGPDGMPHAVKGMHKDLVVVGPAASPPPRNAARDTVTLVDYAFDTHARFEPGVHRVIVRNTSKQSHELELARLLPGKTPADLAAWAEKMAGPPPAHFLGGVSPLAPGQSNELRLDLAPGHYVMLCFVPDARDGKPHVAHGMVHDFVIGKQS